MPRAILFDLDETIVSAYGPPASTWSIVAAELANELATLSAVELCEAINVFAREYWDEPQRATNGRLDLIRARREVVAGALARLEAEGRGSIADDVALRLADRFSELRVEQLKLLPGAHATIDALKEHGVKLALITNGDALGQRAKIARFELASRFDHIQIEGEAGFGKPDERAYVHALRALGVEARDTWMVGDNLEWEIAAPQRLGIYAIWHDAFERGLPANSPIVPDRIIRQLPELLV